jgi:hypothetical protein
MKCFPLFLFSLWIVPILSRETAATHAAEITSLLQRVSNIQKQTALPLQQIQQVRQLAAKVRKLKVKDLLEQYSLLKTRQERRRLKESSPPLKEVLKAAALVGIPTLILTRIINEITLSLNINAAERQLKEKMAELNTESDKSEKAEQELEAKMVMFQQWTYDLGKGTESNIRLFNEELHHKLGK